MLFNEPTLAPYKRHGSFFRVCLIFEYTGSKLKLLNHLASLQPVTFICIIFSDSTHMPGPPARPFLMLDRIACGSKDQVGDLAWM